MGSIYLSLFIIAWVLAMWKMSDFLFCLSDPNDTDHNNEDWK